MKIYIRETGHKGQRELRELNVNPIAYYSSKLGFDFAVLKTYGNRIYANYVDAAEFCETQEEALDIALEIEKEINEEFEKNWGK